MADLGNVCVARMLGVVAYRGWRTGGFGTEDLIAIALSTYLILSPPISSHLISSYLILISAPNSADALRNPLPRDLRTCRFRCPTLHCNCGNTRPSLPYQNYVSYSPMSRPKLGDSETIPAMLP